MELCAILKITNAICRHAYRVIHLMEYLENRSVHKATIIVQNFCGLKVLKVLAKEILSKTKIEQSLRSKKRLQKCRKNILKGSNQGSPHLYTQPFATQPMLSVAHLTYV